MPTIPEVAKRLHAVAAERESGALKALARGVKALERDFTVALGRKAEWGWADLAQISAELDTALRDSGLDQIADDFRQAVEEYAAEVGGLESVTLGAGSADLLTSAFNARVDGWQTVLGDTREWLKERLITQTISPVSSKQLAAELSDQLVRFQQYADTYITTALNDLQADTWKVAGESAGAERWRYVGPDDERRREVCQYLMENGSGDEAGVWTEEDAAEVVDYPGMIGDAWANRGGWNCRHVWVPVLAQ